MSALRKVVYGWVATLLGLAMQGAVAALPTPVQSALDAAHIPGSALSLAVVPLDSPGAAQYWNADGAVNPASTMKLLTTFSALDVLGPAFSWTTDAWSEAAPDKGVLAGNLYIKGSGDPKLTLERLWLLLRDVRAAGVNRITGDIVLDRSALQIPERTSFADDGNDPARAYLVGPDALLTNFHAFRFHMATDARASRVVVDPPVALLDVDNAVRVSANASCNGNGLTFSATPGARGAVRVKVSGALPADCVVDKYQSYLDSPLYTASLLRYLWKETGGDIAGNWRLGSVPAGAIKLAQSQSPDLVSAIRDINKYSNNLMARQLFLTLGAQTRQAGDSDDIAAAVRAVHDVIARHGGDWPELVLENGSGLSREEQISVRHMAQLLQWGWLSPYAPEYISSLPIAAVDGTMKKRLRNTDGAGAHIKTGTLKNVRAAAGYMRGADGRMLAVVVILNHPLAERGMAVIDSTLAWAQAFGAAQ
ncbi:D-alanyl-D-alanine carboxypeptidase/D-alanyl-D-alanine endopeptidase [Amantichitinum ursilacus]|uniref:D-alanyl-D-alanine carboxypeptidase n=1 Tax=Amantichitinum ursilacus TaxID=857265 RepID=A0A0N0XKW6_9NEIS|nr:D-alanyl-D-alanine carboxypeptidase/D-alanyl-D-alanine-endopeptidase [Amantichitinum ursilacus]KPC53583.1 D-alanyl-D-alanine carboxypeptidase precursor [Amantichitinum ursilacus]